MKRNVFYIIFFVLAAASLLPAATITVPDDYSLIQEAIDAAENGDEILILPGTYFEYDIDYMGKAVTVRGAGEAAGETVIDAGGLSRVFAMRSGEGSGSILSNVMVTGGGGRLKKGAGIFVDGASPTIVGCTIVSNIADSLGGGIYCFDSSPLIQGCTIRENASGGIFDLENGGGIYCEGSSPLIEDCLITQNRATGHGGGICCRLNSSVTITNSIISRNIGVLGGGLDLGIDCSADVTDCTVTSNTANSGGGVYLQRDASLDITGSSISNNAATGDYGSGGGLVCFHFHAGGAVYMTDCTFSGNTAVQGGGVCIFQSSDPVEIVDCVIESNTAEDGGGVYMDDSSLLMRRCSITDNFASEHGGGIDCRLSEPVIENCSISENRAVYFGGGIYCHYWSGALITNTIFSGNRAEGSMGFSQGGAINCWEDNSSFKNCTITGNYSEDGGGAIYTDESFPVFTNAIIWGDSPDEIEVASGLPVISYSDVQGGWWGLGNINANPRFVTYHGHPCLLRPASPCIDAGSPFLSDGFDWPPWYGNGTRSDMGAYGGPGNFLWLD